MPIEQLDDRPALIVVDLQAGTLGNFANAGEVVSASATLLDAFRAKRLPVVLARAVGSPAGRSDYGGGARDYPAAFSVLVPELKQQPGDIEISRSAWSAFSGTELDSRLRALGVTQIVLAGVATSFGVESTARAAYDLGYSVVVATDAVTDMREESHEASISRVFPVLSQTATVADVIDLL